MKKIFYTLTFLFYSLIGFSQAWPLDSFDIKYTVDFNAWDTGYYTDAMQVVDWVWGTSADDQGKIVLMDGQKALRIDFPNTGDGGDGLVLQSPGIAAGNYTELYLTFKVVFKRYYDFQQGGKINGFVGTGVGACDDIVAPCNGEGPLITEDGFISRFMWGNEQTFVHYVYHQDMTGQFGDSYFFVNDFPTSNDTFQIATDSMQIHNFTLRLVLNTPGVNNGITEGFHNGKLKYQKTNFNYREYSNIYIDRILLSMFYGGTGTEFPPDEPSYIVVDDFNCFTYTATSVPSGLEASAYDRDLHLPDIWAGGGYSTYDPDTSTEYTVLTSHFINFNDPDNSENPISDYWNNVDDNTEHFQTIHDTNEVSHYDTLYYLNNWQDSNPYGYSSGKYEIQAEKTSHRKFSGTNDMTFSGNSFFPGAIFNIEFYSSVASAGGDRGITVVAEGIYKDSLQGNGNNSRWGEISGVIGEDGDIDLHFYSYTGTNYYINAIVVRILTSETNPYGGTYFVSTIGSDSNPGTFEKPFATWQHAIYAMSPGDTTYIRGGTYQESYSTELAIEMYEYDGTSGNMMNLWAYPGEQPILDCSNLTTSSAVGIECHQIIGTLKD